MPVFEFVRQLYYKHCTDWTKIDVSFISKKYFLTGNVVLIYRIWSLRKNISSPGNWTPMGSLRLVSGSLILG